ncbi:MAG: hypothetical protein HWE11_03710 [Gammaproteobacteria bacterium]|nr:hypothetical protein [Gammaproteobacteria bacterium]
MTTFFSIRGATSYGSDASDFNVNGGETFSFTMFLFNLDSIETRQLNSGCYFLSRTDTNQ